MSRVVIAAAAAMLGFWAGVYRGHETAPLDSELATAQEATGDVAVRFIGYRCGDDGATILTREKPGSDCRASRLLSDTESFPAPSMESN